MNEKVTRKGRNHELLQRRNRKLVERFQYWYNVKRLRYDEVLRLLSEDEFFISLSTVETLIRRNPENVAYLDKLSQDSSKNQLKLFES